MNLIQIDGQVATTDDNGVIHYLDTDEYINRPDVQYLLMRNEFMPYTKVGNKYFVGPPKKKAYIHTGNEDICKRYFSFLTSKFTLGETRDMGDYLEVGVYSDDTTDQIRNSLEQAHIAWEVTSEPPEGTVVDTMDIPPIKQETAQKKELWSDFTQTLVPVDCKGETAAITDDFIYLPNVTSDGYCIENNFEKRGQYWILDVVSRGMRIIHSDKVGYHHEFPISDCL